ncbi:MAG TPA: nuclear transport factor 2 family protein [Thermoanaerobaculia bacterium]|nr:nuclear transport factor 2 family protein [Thermoanaerobaculia bacterium]
MRYASIVILCFAVAVSAANPPVRTEPIDPSRIIGNVHYETDEQEIRRVLDALHDAASKAQLERYFALFAPEAVYIGTDATERWSLEEFRGFVTPYFTQGRGWTYEPTSRHVTLGPENRTAWFDEILENESYGTTRGTGVLVKIEDDWKIVQYHLTIPVPNDLAKSVVRMIREQ